MVTDDVGPAGTSTVTSSPAGASTGSLEPLSVTTRSTSGSVRPLSPATTTTWSRSTGSSRSTRTQGSSSAASDIHVVEASPSKAENGWYSGITGSVRSAYACDDDAVSDFAPISSA